MAIVLGYHGCNQETAQLLLGGSSFQPSTKPYDWLGAGSYFWEQDIQRAYDWAIEHRQAAPCVVGAVIELGNCLDLTTQPGIQAVKQVYESYKALQKQTGNPMPENKDASNRPPGNRAIRLLDRAVIDHLHANYKVMSRREFDTVRALFPEGEELYPGAGFWDKTHVQIAVRNPEQIRGVFRVPGHELEKLGIPDSIYQLPA